MWQHALELGLAPCFCHPPAISGSFVCPQELCKHSCAEGANWGSLQESSCDFSSCSSLWHSDYCGSFPGRYFRGPQVALQHSLLLPPARCCLGQAMLTETCPKSQEAQLATYTVQYPTKFVIFILTTLSFLSTPLPLPKLQWILFPYSINAGKQLGHDAGKTARSISYTKFNLAVGFNDV